MSSFGHLVGSSVLMWFSVRVKELDIGYKTDFGPTSTLIEKINFPFRIVTIFKPETFQVPMLQSPWNFDNTIFRSQITRSWKVWWPQVRRFWDTAHAKSIVFRPICVILKIIIPMKIMIMIESESIEQFNSWRI